MVLFAGPIFQEWYWEPLFFIVVFGPPLVAVAFVVDYFVRRRLGPLGTAPRLGLGAVVVAAGAGLILGAFSLRSDRLVERENRVAARSFDFTPYQAGGLPE